jgi:acetoin utilization deacetylase AcuC-like enzyme
MTTGLLYDARYLDHDTGPGHPERSARLESALNHLERQSWFTDLRALSPSPSDDKWIRTVHTGDYVARADEACKAGHPYLDTPDVSISSASSAVARLAVGGAIALADDLLAGQIDNGFALIRPPGHHAESATALGFCLFNNVAILTRYLQLQYGLAKVLIVDWDVHHGNGTQHIFEDDPSVLYVSLHQYPYYPGSGAYSETGIGSGSGATLNCPMTAGATDTDYEQAFTDRILPTIDAFAPDVVLISAGFDAHRSDPLAQVCLSTSMYEWMTLRLMETADQHAGGRILSLLEGGYDLDALGECVTLHVKTLMR